MTKTLEQKVEELADQLWAARNTPRGPDNWYAGMVSASQMVLGLLEESE